MGTTKSEQDYLETILKLHRRTGFVRSIDIANELGVSRPSVSVAMKRLGEEGHVIMEPGGEILLTDSGREIAESTYERHVTLSRLLIDMGVSEKTAQEDACRIEHDISDETFERIKEHFADS